MRKTIFLQLNELNFPYISRYTELGHLKNFAAFFERHGFVETVSETDHELSNPWIQWPTVHTGLDYKDHGVFRLGDIVKTDHPHIYEVLEQHGVTVAAMSPFNARNNTRAPLFFVPDPWTKTEFVGSRSLRFLYDALCEVADDYAQDKVSLKAATALALGSVNHIRWHTLRSYISDTFAYFFRKKVWYRALVCDRLLFDAFMTQWQQHQPDFSTLFLNGGAHLQHHYLFSSRAYGGASRNPSWHVPESEDPLLDILELYDELLGDLVAAAGDARILIASGLHQEPHERTTYYYRLNDHARFLDRIGIAYKNTYRLMTEDFVVQFSDTREAREAQRTLEDVRTVGRSDIFYLETGDRPVRTKRTSDQIFHIENRGDDLYVQLKPTAVMLPANLTVRSAETELPKFERLTALAQFKNTHHVGLGYLSDSDAARGELPSSVPLRCIFEMITAGFGLRRDVAA